MRKAHINISNPVLTDVLTHFFSQQKIAKTESELFILNLKDPQLVGFVSGNIRRITDGSSSHFAGALKLGLKKAVEFKRRGNGVLLRCPMSHCPRSINPVTYWFVGSNVHCPNCPAPSPAPWRGHNYPMYKPMPPCMQCAGCGVERAEDRQSCRNCSRRFV